jgi:hypothetical protein
VGGTRHDHPHTSLSQDAVNSILPRQDLSHTDFGLGKEWDIAAGYPSRSPAPSGRSRPQKIRVQK